MRRLDLPDSSAAPRPGRNRILLKQPKRVVYLVEDVEAARSWCGKVLGSEPAFDTPVACIFQVGGGSLTLAKGPAASGGEARTSVYWEVDDVDATFARLCEIGARSTTPPNDVLSVRVAQVLDPFGNVLGLCGGIPHDRERTVEKQASETAHAVALCRSLLARDERPRLRRANRFSELFLTREARAVLDDAARRREVIERRISRPLYGFFAARTGFIDEAFQQALRQRTPQIVLLGAGYDTRALRFAADLGGTRIFEVDAPSTQIRKRELLDTSAVPLPPQLGFVTVNFKTDDVIERLREAGYDESRPTLILWEGVTYYLPIESVERTLALLHRHSAPGSALALDYMTAKLPSINAGEPFLSFVEPERLPGWLGHLGFRGRDDLGAAQLTARYLTLEDGTVAERPLTKIRLVYAERAGTPGA